MNCKLGGFYCIWGYIEFFNNQASNMRMYIASNTWWCLSRIRIIPDQNKLENKQFKKRRYKPIKSAWEVYSRIKALNFRVTIKNPQETLFILLWERNPNKNLELKILKSEIKINSMSNRYLNKRKLSSFIKIKRNQTPDINSMRPDFPKGEGGKINERKKYLSQTSKNPNSADDPSKQNYSRNSHSTIHPTD